MHFVAAEAKYVLIEFACAVMIFSFCYAQFFANSLLGEHQMMLRNLLVAAAVALSSTGVLAQLPAGSAAGSAGGAAGGATATGATAGAATAGAGATGTVATAAGVAGAASAVTTAVVVGGMVAAAASVASNIGTTTNH